MIWLPSEEMVDSPKKRILKNRVPKKDKSPGDTWEDLSSTISVESAENSPEYRVLPSNPPTSPAKSRIRGLRLLIVNDDPIRVDALAMDLRNLGAIVAVGDRFTSGYTQAAKFLPDAIISDLIRPDEPGFRFIQTLRRHPLLRWSSVILSTWWKETGEGEGQVMLDQVLDQLEELLAPVRIIEERIAAKRPLGDRMEMTGPAALLRLLANANLTGALWVNDGWNKFTVEMSEGRILSAFRKGIDGKADDALDAIIQFMLSDTGRWTFEHRKQERSDTALDTEETLTRTNRILSRLFGQRLKKDPTLADHIIVRPHFLRTATETVSPSAIEIARDVADGADLARFKKFFIHKNDLTDVERIVHTLFRCGAIRYVEVPISTNRTQKDRAAAESVVNLLGALHDNPFAPKTVKSRIPKPDYQPFNQGGGDEDQGVPKGAYHLQDVAPERVAVAKLRPVKLNLENKNSPPLESPPEGKTAPQPPRMRDIVMGVEADTTDLMNPTNRDVSARKRRYPKRRAPNADDSHSRKLIMESQQLALDYQKGGRTTLPPEETRDLRHMWVAIALALLLGALLVTGIILISSVDRSRDVDGPRSQGTSSIE
jgi:CheY-like chemotaxis protein